MAAARVAVLGTTNADGTPHLVPITFVLTGDVLHTAVDHKPKTTTSLRRLDNIRRHPHVTVLVQHYSEDWAELWWCRGRGSATIRPGPPPQALLDRYESYAEAPPWGPTIEVLISSWRGWAATA